jgi:hypothetical protein
MKPLIDADVLLYECSAVAEYPKDEPIKSFNFVEEVFLNRVREICLAVEATEEPLLYITGKGNFREEVAVTKPYKGTRKEEKPFHYKNLLWYLRSLPNCIEVEGMEADDAMAIEQHRNHIICPVSGLTDIKTTVICTRDKDLRMVSGWHYGWECGRQPEFMLQWVDELGKLELVNGKIKGTGLRFFYSQLLTGDTVDNIPGLKGVGPVAAYEALKDCEDERELYEAVCRMYEEKLGDDYDCYLREQAHLLWMVRELDEDDNPVMWRAPI